MGKRPTGKKTYRDKRPTGTKDLQEQKIFVDKRPTGNLQEKRQKMYFFFKVIKSEEKKPTTVDTHLRINQSNYMFPVIQIAVSSNLKQTKK